MARTKDPITASVDRLIHSPWFIVFLAAIPVALVISLMDVLSGRTRVVEIVVEVVPNKANGDSWDPKGGFPDIEIKLEQKRGIVFTCPLAPDALRASCVPGVEVLPRSGKLQFEVNDLDSAFDDRIGVLELEVPTSSGRRVFENIEQVRRVEVDVRWMPLSLAAFYSRFVAIGIGLSAASLVWLLVLRRRSTRDEPLALLGVRAITWIAGTAVLLGIIVGIGAELSSTPVRSWWGAMPCVLGAASVGLVWIHGRASERYTTMDGMLLFLAFSVILMPIVLKAALIVAGLGLLYLLVVALLEGNW